MIRACSRIAEGCEGANASQAGDRLAVQRALGLFGDLRLDEKGIAIRDGWLRGRRSACIAPVLSALTKKLPPAV
jgi:hypothetical protein